MKTQTYGEWTVIEDPSGQHALCRCSCGNEHWVLKNNLSSGKTSSCGHARRTAPPLAAGDIVGEWKVLSREGRVASVRCSCGETKDVNVYSLLRGDSLSCGHARKTGPRARLTWMWKWMHSRCYNVEDPMYLYYGGRGITVCKAWHDVDVYIAWALRNGWQKSSGLQIDRINNDRGYSPQNCRVTTNVVNANNKSNNNVLTAFGETKTLGQWVVDPRCAVAYPTLWARAKTGTMKPEKMISTPTLHRGGRPRST